MPGAESNKTKVFILCPGAGRDFRGFEAHATGLFHHCTNNPHFEFYLIKGGGKKNKNELRVPIIYRQYALAKILGSLFRRNPYVIQCASFFLSQIPTLLRYRPKIVYVLDPPLYHYLSRWRVLTRASFVMIFNTSGDTVPVNFHPRDVVHGVTPESVSLAKRRGIAEHQIRLIPHFIDVLPKTETETTDRKAIRRELALPDDRLIVLSVGAIDTYFKRMDYVVREVGKLKVPYFLVMLGEMEPESTFVMDLAKSTLPAGSYMIKRVPRPVVMRFLQAADIYTLASLREGFGMASLEALAYGLPVVLHDHENARYSIGPMGIYGDLSREGNLTALLEANLSGLGDEALVFERKKYVASRFSWDALKSQYKEMFHLAESANQPVNR